MLLIDTTVTEYRPMRVGAYDRELSRQMVRHAQAWAAEHGALPIFIIYPHRYYLDDLGNGIANFDPAAYFRELCEDIDLPYIDGFELLQQMADRWRRPVESLYMDEAHLSPGIAQILGAAIGERVWRFVSHEMGQATYDISHQTLAHPFKCVELVDVARPALANSGEEVTSRNVVTSLLEQPMITVFKNEPVTVPVPEGWEVVALTINARRCNGAVRLTGANEVSRRMDFAKYEGETGYPFVCVRSLVTPVVPKNGYVTMECVDPQDDFEPDEITNAVMPTESPELGEIEVGQFVIRCMDRTDPYVRVRGVRLNLTPGVDLSFAFAS